MERKQVEYIAARLEVSRLWRHCCEHDGIPTDSKFVVFSNDNPELAEYNEAMGRLLKLRAS